MYIFRKQLHTYMQINKNTMMDRICATILCWLEQYIEVEKNIGRLHE